jgi:hypothetical protein
MAQTIITKQLTDLSKEEFRFDFVHGNLILDSYTIYEKATLRSKYKPTKFYNKISERDSKIKECEVPLTIEVRCLAYEEFIKGIKVLTHTELKSHNENN